MFKNITFLISIYESLEPPHINVVKTALMSILVLLSQDIADLYSVEKPPSPYSDRICPGARLISFDSSYRRT